jgi:GAF domain-containing protein
MPAADPILHAIVEAAAQSTGARDGWLAAHDDAADELIVVAAVGLQAGSLLGATVHEDEGYCGAVVASAQPIALEATAADSRFADGLATRLGRQPQTVLCVPCEHDDVVLGAIELVDKASGGFSLADLELVTVLADVAAAALLAGVGGPALIATPAELGRQLEALAIDDPIRYAHVAQLVGTLIRHD